MNLKTIISESSTKIIDVRTPGEFMGGHVAGSINIPLNELPSRLEEFSSTDGALVLCCASGNRSGQAAMFLKQNGFDNVYNGGPWTEVNFVKNN